MRTPLIFKPLIELTQMPDPNITILLNGREVRYLDGLNTKLKHGNVVAFVPPIAGG